MVHFGCQVSPMGVGSGRGVEVEDSEAEEAEAELEEEADEEAAEEAEEREEGSGSVAARMVAAKSAGEMSVRNLIVMVLRSKEVMALSGYSSSNRGRRPRNKQ